MTATLRAVMSVSFRAITLALGRTAPQASAPRMNCGEAQESESNMQQRTDESTREMVSGALEAQQLGKRYGRKWALNECTFQLPRGRIAALVGPNGAGKTTLLHLCMGLLKPSAGRISVLGRDPARQPIETLPNVGFVAQDHPLYNGFTVADTLTFGRKMNPRWDNELALSRLRQLDIPLDQHVGKLSGGQRSQVALAIALAKRPQLLLLDEPVASLDPLARRDFLRTLVEAARGNDITTMLSSHIVADLEQSCDYLIILSASRVQLVGEIADICASHRLLAGPGDDHAGAAAMRAMAEVVDENRTLQSVSILIRASEGGLPAVPQGWRVEEAPLESIVLAYLGQSTRRAVSSDSATHAYPAQLEVR